MSLQQVFGGKHWAVLDQDVHWHMFTVATWGLGPTRQKVSEPHLIGAADLVDGGCAILRAQTNAMRNSSGTPHERELYSEECCLVGWAVRKGKAFLFWRDVHPMLPKTAFRRSWLKWGYSTYLLNLSPGKHGYYIQVRHMDTCKGYIHKWQWRQGCVHSFIP